MAPIGLAHRPTVTFVAEWTDVEIELRDDDLLREIVERRRREAAEAVTGAAIAAAGAAGRREELRPDEPSPDGWLAGEPMF